MKGKLSAMRNTLLLFLFAAFVTLCQAQDTLRVEDAVAIALSQNYDLQLAANKLRMADRNRSLLNSNYLPGVSASAGTKYGNANSRIILQNDMDNEVKGAQSLGYNAAVALNYLWFNGFARKALYQKQKAAYQMADMQLKEEINTSLLEVYQAYYQVLSLSLQKDILKDAFEISKQRLRKLQYQYEYAQKTQLDVLNAQVDANNDSLDMVNVMTAFENAKRNLNYLLGENIGKDFLVEEEVEIGKMLDINEIREKMLTNNYRLQQLGINKKMSEYDLKIAKSAWVPSLGSSVSYSLNNTLYDELNTYKEQDYNGLNMGLNLSWNIFDGGASHVRAQNAKINLENQEIQRRQLTAALETQLQNTWNDYRNQLAVIVSDRKNVAVSEENFFKTKEKYEAGLVNSIFFRQAQLNWVNAKVKLLKAKFDAKISELKLRKLQGDLLDN